LKIVPFIHTNGNQLIAITGNGDSTLAKNSDIHLETPVEREACILHLAPTTSTTAQLALGDALACALMRVRNFSAQDFARLHPGGSLGRRLLMRVGQIMRNHDLPIVSEDATAVEMIHAISRGGLGLIVVQRDNKILGIITDGDIRRAMEQRQAGFFDIRPMDIATREPKTIHPDSKLIEAERQMTQHKVNSLLVVDDETLVGVIQIYDIKL
jgi:arabinose-5-phosphate isomerase